MSVRMTISQTGISAALDLRLASRRISSRGLPAAFLLLCCCPSGLGQLPSPILSSMRKASRARPCGSSWYSCCVAAPPTPAQVGSMHL